MKFKTIATISALLTFLNAVFFLLLPEFSLSLLGRNTNLIGIMNTRISGACALGLSTLTWSARNTKSLEVQKIVYIGNMTTFCILIIIDFHGAVINAINELGWLIFLIDLLIFLGFVLSVLKFRAKKY